MTKESDFLSRWLLEKEFYLAWGTLISTTVQQRLASVIAPVLPDHFLRTPISPRLKEDQKLIEKAFYRKKNYSNPYDDITDKVGTRFVVLLGSDVRKVKEALTSIEGWTFSKDRDYEEEQKRNPFKFDYAAVHFIVRAEEEIDTRGIKIPALTPCEVQIKTLLQHAYSELTHDTIYKPQIEATHFMQRNAAKAMALLEATNDYFERVADEVNTALASVRRMTAELSTVYRDVVGVDPKPTVLEGLLLSAYEATVQNDLIDELKVYLSENSFIPGLIRNHLLDRNPIFAQPSVLLVYLSVHKSVRKAQEAWPLTMAEMEPLLNDIGDSIN